MVAKDANLEDVRKYYAALRRAQADIDFGHQQFVHYYLRELPERFHSLVDVRAFGPGERLVFEPYTKDVYDRTHAWVEEPRAFRSEQSRARGVRDGRDDLSDFLFWASALAAVRARGASFRGRPRATAISSDLRHPPAIAEYPIQQARDIVIDVKRAPVQAFSKLGDFDFGHLGRRRGFQAL